MVFKRVGFFETAEAVQQARRHTSEPLDSGVLAYLASGRVVLASAQWIDDLLDPEKSICQFAVLTDGIWVWPSSLEFYVRAYEVELPESFVREMQMRDWAVPPVGDAQLDAISDWLISEGS